MLCGGILIKDDVRREVLLRRPCLEELIYTLQPLVRLGGMRVGDLGMGGGISHMRTCLKWKQRAARSKERATVRKQEAERAAKSRPGTRRVHERARLRHAAPAEHSVVVSAIVLVIVLALVSVIGRGSVCLQLFP